MQAIPIRVGRDERIVGYLYHLGVGMWFVATAANAWDGPRYAKRICDY